MTAVKEPSTEAGRRLAAQQLDTENGPVQLVPFLQWIIAIEDEARAPLAAAIRLMVVRHHEGVYDYATCDVCSSAVAAIGAEPESIDVERLLEVLRDGIRTDTESQRWRDGVQYAIDCIENAAAAQRVS